jgi:hypothetical protein
MMGALAVQRVGGDRRTAQVGQAVQSREERRQLVTAAHLGLGQHHPVRVIEHRDQRGLPAEAGARATQGLAVEGQRRPVLGDGTAVAASTVGFALRGRAPGQHPPGQRLLHDGHLGRGEHPSEGGRVRAGPADGDRRVGALCPLLDRGAGARPPTPHPWRGRGSMQHARSYVRAALRWSNACPRRWGCATVGRPTQGEPCRP